MTTLAVSVHSRRARPIVPSAPAAPFVKWAGGKTRLLRQLLPLLPTGVERMRHVEPFVGGGAFFFHRRPTRAFLSDVNPTLIETYECVRDHVEEVIEVLMHLAARHNSHAYYETRHRYNSQSTKNRAERAATFIYLNKTCFNGLHRVNQQGEFNVPMGRYAKPRIVDPLALRAASRVLIHAELQCTSFESLLSRAQPGDFIYLDPPYEPVSSSANFTSYSRDGFSRHDQQRLRDVFRELDRRKCKLMLSNSDVPFIRELYSEWNIDVVAAPRAINCNALRRGLVSELVIRNYRNRTNSNSHIV